MPTTLHNPGWSELMGELEHAGNVSDDTELLFYFVGHSVSSGENDINLILGLDQEKRDRYCSLNWFLVACTRFG